MTYEYHGDRFRVFLGDLSFGEGWEAGGTFQAGLSIGEDIEEFIEYGEEWPKDSRDKQRFVSHSLVIQFWHWGLYVSVRGRDIR